MGLTVDEEGLAKDVHITAPLGYGLDENAVHAVQTWSFKPAEKDGQRVRPKLKWKSLFTCNERKESRNLSTEKLSHESVWKGRGFAAPI